MSISPYVWWLCSMILLSIFLLAVLFVFFDKCGGAFGRRKKNYYWWFSKLTLTELINFTDLDTLQFFFFLSCHLIKLVFKIIACLFFVMKICFYHIFQLQLATYLVKVQVMRAFKIFNQRKRLEIKCISSHKKSRLIYSIELLSWINQKLLVCFRKIQKFSISSHSPTQAYRHDGGTA